MQRHGLTHSTHSTHPQGPPSALPSALPGHPKMRAPSPSLQWISHLATSAGLYERVAVDICNTVVESGGEWNELVRSGGIVTGGYWRGGSAGAGVDWRLTLTQTIVHGSSQLCRKLIPMNEGEGAPRGSDVGFSFPFCFPFLFSFLDLPFLISFLRVCVYTAQGDGIITT